MSIRLRLTLLYSTILALTLIAFGAILYTIQSRYTLNVLERDLALNAERVAERLNAFHHVRFARPVPQDTPPDWVREFGPQVLQELRVRDVVWILTADGTTYERSSGRNEVVLPLSESGLQAAQDGQVWVEIVPVEGERTLIYTRPVIAGDQVIGIVQVGRPLTDRDRSLAALGGTLIVGTVLTTVIAFAIGWALSGITLRPIHRITQTAQAIGEERDFDRRVAHTGPNDEIGQLAETFNAMLNRLQQAYRQVAQALQVQRDFLADVSHELRTPLTTIRGNLALLGRSTPIEKEEREDILADMVDESERLIRLVNDILALARAEAGRQMQRERVPLKPLIEDVCRQARMLAPDREIECDALEDVATQADRDALKQVLLILCDNALKHTTGPIRVTLIEHDQQVAIGVHDTGPGISPELSERIFDRFYRGDASRSTAGFGLGLSIADALVGAQHGTLEVDSDVARGSTFTVTLPMDPA
jgi:two-component system, OmpR family, sensor kinase